MKVTYRGYIASPEGCLVSGITGSFVKDVPREVTEDEAALLAGNPDFEIDKPTKNSAIGGDES